MNSSKGQLRLQRCRALLAELDPDKPPAAVNAREFSWQYRALRERVHLYSERLEGGNEALAGVYDLRKAEMAIELSLEYFRNVLAPRPHPDDEDGEG